jgi:ABC-type uncharacterized transport system auxiliary subunit
MKKLILVFILFIMVGCSSKVNPLKIYTITTPEVQAVTKSKYRAKSIKVMFPESLKEKLSNKMHFSYSSSEQGYYQNSQWSNNMAKLLQGNIIETLEHSKLFSGVVSYVSTAQADYRLESTVFALTHQVRGEESRALVSIQFSLISTSTGKLMKSKRFSYGVPTKTTNAAGYVKATNDALAMLSADLVEWLH